MRHVIRRAAMPLAAVAAMLVVSAPAQALPPLTNVSCGQTITTSIRMNNDLVGCTGDGLVIGASGVSIDMNFHTITGDNTPAFAPDATADNGIENDGHDNTEVKNGTIRNFNWSVGFMNGTDASRIYNVRSFGARNDGLLLQGNGSTADFNDVALGGTATADNGMLVTGSGNRITRNEITGGWVGINVGLGDSLVDRNTITGAQFGIGIGGAGNTTFSRNETSGGQIGIALQVSGHNVKFIENNANGAAQDGFELNNLDAASSLVDNEADDNGDDGIDIQSGSPTLTGNEVDNNGDWGIEAPATVVDGGGNDGSGNGQAAQCQNISC